MALNLLDFEAWCLADLGHRPATVKKVVGRVRHMARNGLDWDRFLESPEDARQQARQFLAAYARGPHKQALVNYSKALNVVARYVSRPGGDERFELLKWKAKRPPRAQPKTFTLEQVEDLRGYKALNDQAHLRHRALLWLMENTGLRRSEIAAIQEPDLDQLRQALVVRAPAKEGRQRRIPLHPDAWSPDGPLQVWLRVRPIFPGKPDHIWTSKVGVRVIVSNGDDLARQLASVSRRVGFPVTFQRFRHWRARYLLKQGVGLRVIQELMGHSDPKTTAWYAGVDLETMHGELARCHVPGFQSAGVSGTTLEALG